LEGHRPGDRFADGEATVPPDGKGRDFGKIIFPDIGNRGAAKRHKKRRNSRVWKNDFAIHDFASIRC
jgi:hypothetical protein